MEAWKSTQETNSSICIYISLWHLLWWIGNCFKILAPKTATCMTPKRLIVDGIQWIYSSRTSFEWWILKYISSSYDHFHFFQFSLSGWGKSWLPFCRQMSTPRIPAFSSGMLYISVCVYPSLVYTVCVSILLDAYCTFAQYKMYSVYRVHLLKTHSLYCTKQTLQLI